LNRPVRSARKAKGDGYLRRAEILDAAERIFVRDGYQGATIRKIADEVGLSSTALYMHFRDKDQILLEICSGAMGQLLANAREMAAQPIDPQVRVRKILEAYMRFGLENPNTYWLTLCSGTDELPVGPGSVPNEIGSRCYAIFEGVIAEVGKEGRLRNSVALTGQLLWSACHGMVALRIGRPHNIDWAPNEQLIQSMLDSIFHGLLVD
jgi:AcrR family transcriptional regulator